MAHGLMHAQQGRIGLTGEAGLPVSANQTNSASSANDIAADLTVGVEQRLRRQAAELKNRRPGQLRPGLWRWCLPATPHALGGDVLGDVFIHFNGG